MKALIVDDEIYSVRAIKNSVNWEKLGINQVLTAFHVEQAKKICTDEKIDLIISDIEMPEQSGLDFLRWINERKMNTAFLIVSCHSEFSYAQEALRLKGCGYLVKPLNFEELETEIIRVLESLLQRRDIEEKSKFGTLWKKNENIVSQEWWKKLLISDSKENTKRLLLEACDAGVEISLDSYYLIFIQICKVWYNLENGIHQKVIKAIQNLSYDILQGDFSLNTSCIIDKNIVIVCNGHKAYGELEQKCRYCIREAEDILQTEINVYIGNPVGCEELSSEYHDILNISRRDMLHGSGIYYLKSEKRKNLGESSLLLPDQLIEQLNRGKFQEIENHLESILSKGGTQGISRQALIQFREDLIQIISVYLHSKGIKAHTCLCSEYLIENEDNFTISVMVEWVKMVMSTITTKIEEQKNDEGYKDCVKKSCIYIKDHLGEIITREDVARQVHLNADYLNRIFKKETGYTIADYLTRERVLWAESLLINSEMSVSEIAMEVGIRNFSYFSSVFRKITGCSPKEYRIKSSESLYKQ